MSYPSRHRWLRSGLSLVIVVALACASLRAADDDDSKPAKAADKAASDGVPDGKPQLLLKYIEKMQATSPQGGSRSARMDDMRRIQKSIITAAEKIVAAKPDDETAAAALRAQIGALTLLKRLGDDDAGEKLDALVAELKNDKRPGILQMVEYQSLVKQREDLDTSSEEDVEAFLGNAKSFLKEAKLDSQIVPLAVQVVQLSQQTQSPLEAAETARDMAIGFAKSDDPKVSVYASQFVMFAGRLFESEEKTGETIKSYEQVAELLAKSDNPEISGSADKLQGAIRQLKMIGNPIDVKGTLVDGKKFDWSKFKGQVVLVDFWATWCGPCIAELPNVKEVYEKYHDQGFDVVGISLDEDREALESFIEKEHLRWPILFSSDPKATGWEHPMATYYGISAIPATVLVNREGKVVTLSARGEKLGELVAELLGAEQAADGSKDDQPAKRGQPAKK